MLVLNIPIKSYNLLIVILNHETSLLVDQVILDEDFKVSKAVYGFYETQLLVEFFHALVVELKELLLLIPLLLSIPLLLKVAFLVLWVNDVKNLSGVGFLEAGAKEVDAEELAVAAGTE